MPVLDALLRMTYDVLEDVDIVFYDEVKAPIVVHARLPSFLPSSYFLARSDG
jgi:hypothetical protein